MLNDSWHLMSRERGQFVSDRVATERVEFVRIAPE
ncbi:immunity 63 family protein [Gordonia oryzae]|nr:immunity 63 family protein [Gordonia oryzae]